MPVGELSKYNSVGISGIYCNENDNQEGLCVFVHDKPYALYLRSHVINQFDWSKWKQVRDLTKVDPYLLSELLRDDYKFDLQKGGLI